MECEHLLFIGGSRGRAQCTPPTGPNSFIFTYIFTEKCPHRGAVATNGLMPTHPNGKSWIHDCYSSIISPVVDPGGSQRPQPLPLLKLVKKKMATTPHCKFCKSLAPPWTNFWICNCSLSVA